MKVVFFRSRFDRFWFLLALVLTIFAAPGMASAQSLGTMMCLVAVNIFPFAKLFSGFAYIIGAILIGMGLSQLAFFTDTFTANKQFGIARPKGMIIAGACLLALPSFMGWLVNSLFGFQNLGTGIVGCVPGLGFGGGGGGVGLDGLMLNLIYNIKGPLVFLLSILCMVMGIFMVIRGLIKGSQFGQNPKSSIPNIFANIVIGTILYTIGTSMNAIVSTLFGTFLIWGDFNVMTAIQSNFGGNTQPFQNGVYAALTFVQLVGMIAFVRGWIIIRDAVEAPGQKTVAQGLTHIIGGACALNIYAFLQAMDNSFGTSFLS